MKLPPVVTVPDPILRQSLTPVTAFNAELESLIATMFHVMHQAEGVGLAANQIGVDARVFVYGIAEPFELNGRRIQAVPNQAVINPEISIIGDQTDVFDEGCLSIPGLRGPVERALEIELSGLDQHGQPLRRRLTGYEARIVQHETDHLNGRLFLDHIADPSKLYRIKE